MRRGHFVVTAWLPDFATAPNYRTCGRNSRRSRRGSPNSIQTRTRRRRCVSRRCVTREPTSRRHADGGAGRSAVACPARGLHSVACRPATGSTCGRRRERRSDTRSDRLTRSGRAVGPGVAALRHRDARHGVRPAPVSHASGEHLVFRLRCGRVAQCDHRTVFADGARSGSAQIRGRRADGRRSREPRRHMAVHATHAPPNCSWRWRPVSEASYLSRR